MLTPKQIIEALNERTRVVADVEGFTAQEYAAQNNVSETTGRMRVRAMLAKGVIERVGDRIIPRTNKGYNTAPLYNLVKVQTEKAPKK